MAVASPCDQSLPYYRNFFAHEASLYLLHALDLRDHRGSFPLPHDSSVIHNRDDTGHKKLANGSSREATMHAGETAETCRKAKEV